MMTQGILRPSNLPKLKHCAWYRNSDAEPSEAAARGTVIDTVYREIMTGLQDFPDGSAAEIAAADWAACETDRITGQYPVVARKEECAVLIPGFPAPGEVDCLCPKLFCCFDVKSGLEADYELQQAAYAWALMGKFFASRWTIYVLFCDLRRVCKYEFTYAEAKRLVLEVVARWQAAPAPAFNSYCSWCGNAAECPVLVNRADHALSLVEKPNFDFVSLLANPQRLGAFLSACRAIEPYQQQAQDRVKQYLLAKTNVPGWSLVTRAPGKYVEPATVTPLTDKLGIVRVLQEYGNLSEVKYAKLCAEARINPDSAAVKTGAGTTYLCSVPELTTKGN
jgi:hypothetical protein